MAQPPVPNLEKYVDMADGLKRICNNKMIYKKLLGTFQKTLQIDQLCQETAAGDLEAAVKTAHSIKGVTANLSLKAAYEKCVTVETDLKNGVCNDADVQELKEILDTTLLCTEYLIGTL